ncbi:hypothetical protein PLICRDRAFT_170195 [Plicaturopsis crispa FD-325 SS-3]|nr:hypothetical protein PLICRDRAFT_170195 [Plicaturopsis crispa FD-325 SS-3]
MSIKDRTRVVTRKWERDPKGPFLPRDDNAPIGSRTRNGIIWGHSIDDFFWVERKPGVNMVGIWTLSMLAAFGEFGGSKPGEPDITLDDIENCFPSLRIKPRRRRVWPVLKVPKTTKVFPPLSVLDDGSDHEEVIEGHSFGTLDERALEWDEEDERGPRPGEDPTEPSTAASAPPNAMDVDNETITKPPGSPPSPNSPSSYALPPSVDPFCLDGVPKLEEFIPRQYFPDIIYVHDKNDVCVGSYSTKTTAGLASKRYKRVFPKLETHFPSGDASSRVAHVYVSSANLMGSGHHSHVYSAAIRLPHPLSARSPNKLVTVALKTAMREREDRSMLENEAEIYNSMPSHLMEEWCGLNLVSPIKYPVPVGAVVPKFYGYYVPDFDEPTHDKKGKVLRSWEKSSPILLLEDCGKPISPKGHKMTLDQKTECYSLFARLHYENISQQSVFTRNIVVQPGPLTRPPHERTMKHPSYRIIDFGRAIDFGPKFDQLEKKGPAKDHETEWKELNRSWADKRRPELTQATQELGLEMM